MLLSKVKRLALSPNVYQGAPGELSGTNKPAAGLGLHKPALQIGRIHL